MNEVYVQRVKRILTAQITKVTSKQAKELIDLIHAKVNDDPETNAQPDSGKRDPGAA